jgi:5-dehydro-2-deoxygluconokinase
MALSRIAMNRFLVLGRAGMDLYADPPGTRVEEAARFTAALGGSAANIAAGICRLGGEASLLTSVSDDAVGRFVTLEMQRYKIGTTHVRLAKGEARTSLAVVETRLEDTQSVIYRNGVADFQLSQEHVRSVDFSAYGALIVTGTALAVEPSRAACFLAMKMAKSAGLPVVLDIDYRPYSWANAKEAAAINLQAAQSSDIVIGNDVEFAVIASGAGLKQARELARASAKIVVYKMGENGSVTLHDGQEFETGIYRVEALKPTGAGDAFMAGFITGLAMGMSGGLDVRACVLRGSAAAAIVVTRVGCAPAMPLPDELSGFMAKHFVSI